MCEYVWESESKLLSRDSTSLLNVASSREPHHVLPMSAGLFEIQKKNPTSKNDSQITYLHTLRYIREKISKYFILMPFIIFYFSTNRTISFEGKLGKIFLVFYSFLFYLQVEFWMKIFEQNFGKRLHKFFKFLSIYQREFFLNFIRSKFLKRILEDRILEIFFSKIFFPQRFQIFFFEGSTLNASPFTETKRTIYVFVLWKIWYAASSRNHTRREKSNFFPLMHNILFFLESAIFKSSTQMFSRWDLIAKCIKFWLEVRTCLFFCMIIARPV